MTAVPSTSPRAQLTERAGATRIAVAILGVVAGMAAVEHGVGEIHAAPGAPESLVIRSWPDIPSFAPLSGEPAMTVIPDLLLSGILTIAVGALVAIAAVGFAHRRHGGALLIGLATLLLLVGGGFGPPVLVAALGLAAVRTTRPLRHPVGRFRRRLADVWPALLTVTVAAYLGLFPGVVLLHRFAGVDSAALVTALVILALAGLVLTLLAATAKDRPTPASHLGRTPRLGGELQG